MKVFRTKAPSHVPGVWLPVLGASSPVLVQLLIALFGRSQPVLKIALQQKARESLIRATLPFFFSQPCLCSLWNVVQPHCSQAHPGHLSCWPKLTGLPSLYHYTLTWQFRLLAEPGWCPQIRCAQLPHIQWDCPFPVRALPMSALLPRLDTVLPSLSACPAFTWGLTGRQRFTANTNAKLKKRNGNPKAQAESDCWSSKSEHTTAFTTPFTHFACTDQRCSTVQPNLSANILHSHS